MHIDHAVDKILKLGRPQVGMLGLSFKTGTDDLRESPLVMVAKRLIGEGCELRIFDPEVHLSRLLGANRSYIDAHIPHLGSLLCEQIDEMIDPVGGDPRWHAAAGAGRRAAGARAAGPIPVIDLVNLPNRDLLRCRYEGRSAGSRQFRASGDQPTCIYKSRMRAGRTARQPPLACSKPPHIFYSPGNPAEEAKYLN